MGIGGETAQTIAARQGGLTLTPSGPFTLGSQAGASVTFTGSQFKDSTGGEIVPRANYGLYYGWEGTCYLNGVAGTITNLQIDTTVVPRGLKSLTFTRLEAGEALTVTQGEKALFVPNGNQVKGDINIIFVGQNGWHDADGNGTTDNDDLILIINKMIENVPDPNKTIVIGLHTGNREQRASLEAKMLQTYGNRYINLREYLANAETLKSAGVTPTQEDLERIEIGAFPKSLWQSESDNVHLNAIGYSLLANKVYETLQTLNWLQ